MSKQHFYRTTFLITAIQIGAFLLLGCVQQPTAPTPPPAPPTKAPTVVIASPTPTPKTTPTAAQQKASDDKETPQGDEKYPMAYDFTAKDLLTGDNFSLSDYRGKIVFLNFWGSWCPPCRMEMPSFEKVYEEYGDDIVVIGVGINDSAGNLTQFAKSIGVTYPIVHDRTSEIARHYRIRSLPTTYRIDQDGRVRGVAVGALTEEQLKKAIAELQK